MKIFNKKITYPWLKDNLSMIILLPTISGGVWQLMELFTMGTAYIRFFSISQLIPDGILILVFMSLIAAFSTTYLRGLGPFLNTTENKSANPSKDGATEELNPIHLHLNTESNPPNIHSTPKKRNKIISIVILIGILTILTFFIWPDITLLFTKNNNLGMIGFMIFFSILSLYISLIIALVSDINEIWSLKKILNTKIGKLLTAIIVPFIFVGAIWAIIVFSNIFHKAFSLPEDLKNRQYLSCLLKSTNKELTSFKILYFNDKYIFVRIFEKPKTNYIEVLKFDEFVNKSGCENGK